VKQTLETANLGAPVFDINEILSIVAAAGSNAHPLVGNAGRSA
jgi:hypothetical protein